MRDLKGGARDLPLLGLMKESQATLSTSICVARGAPIESRPYVTKGFF